MLSCTGNTGRSPVLTGELVPVNWHGLQVKVTKGPVRSSGFLIMSKIYTFSLAKRSQLNILKIAETRRTLLPLRFPRSSNLY